MCFSNNRVSVCRYGCQTPIKFDDKRVRLNGLKTPLNLDDTSHNCVSRPYNRRRQQLLTQIPKGNNEWSIKACKYCGQPITFNDNVRAPSGRRIPLNPNGSHHECPYNQYNLSRRCL